MFSRRGFLGTAALVSASAVSGRVQAASIPEAVHMDKAVMQPPLHPVGGPDYRPVVTLNGWTLPFRMNGDWKEFHLVAEPVVREFAEGMKVNLWGYNGQSPGPTIEAVEGDKVRIFVTNRLPEYTTVHWHGMIIPSGMDGVGGLTQPHIEPGKTFVYEFEMKKSGTFMYHPHSDEMVQMAMGMMGMVVVHPRDPNFRPVDRDFVFVMSTYRVDPGTYLPRVNEMTDFNMWTWNARVFPGIDPLPVRLGDKVRVRIGNLSMTNHPIHLHGHSFAVTCTDGGWIPESAQYPETTTDVPVGAVRVFDVARRQSRRLGVSLPQVAPHHECDGARHAQHDRRLAQGSRQGGRQARARRHGDGAIRHGDGQHGDAGARQHAADDERHRPVRPDRDGRHVHGDEDPREPRARRLSRSRPLSIPARHRRLRGRLARGGACAAAGLARAQDEDVSVSMNHQLETTMKTTIKLALTLAALSIAPAFAHEGHDHHGFSAGEPGDPKKPARTIEIALSEMSYEPSNINVKRGEQIRFVLRNVGKEDHEFLLATT